MFYFIAALVSVSEEVRSRCRVKHTFTSIIPDSPTFDNFAVDNHLKTAKRPNRYVHNISSGFGFDICDICFHNFFQIFKSVNILNILCDFIIDWSISINVYTVGEEKD